MSTIFGIFGNLFVMMLLLGLFNFIIYAFKVRKVVKKHQDDPNVKGVKIVDGKVEVIEKDATILDAQIKEEIKDMVTDPVCHAEIEKTKAYHVIRNDESHYFCSWDCREKFLKPAQEEHL